MTTPSPAHDLLTVTGLSVKLRTASGPATVVDDVSLAVAPGRILGIAGESGSGKTMTGMTLVGLPPAGATVTGSIRLDGRELTTLSEPGWAAVRGGQIAMVFQDPSSSLHPMLTMGRQLTDHMRRHLGLSRKAATTRSAELLDLVRLPDPKGALRLYPHQFSGGMRQRVAIAVALAAEPRVLIADEPTTALDVTVQAGIINLLDELRHDTGMSILLVTHDLGVISALADEIAVFYGGRIVESGTAAQVLGGARHPYTRGLLEALPRLSTETRRDGRGFVPIPGVPPTPGSLPAGCAFHPRCAHAAPACQESRPELLPLAEPPAWHRLACHVDPWRP
ncbi:ABC transporter ATP-binding protein [Acrocarpospora pleiomorpha]|uniref:ABC transporter ATP-binding protein n=1 Tax=Acrocarpospora pleiomorpha TaxID=90975 RepID=A0A5M3XKQ0_9ACTN|nr:ABC transporter ATP-binding protein [Acrocarpospora pleiomorpha]GES20729.1 ABC transporter ATP-binding protein [Acrocarpospora pleiomorpha]